MPESGALAPGAVAPETASLEEVLEKLLAELPPVRAFPTPLVRAARAEVERFATRVAGAA